ncbi:hypothetical protein MJO28_007201 [Puccinia striiformis f. sp. tritici]|uniref:Uncharacterized protein n=1 Tax=Puccinia striiformis f. sp. tritici TaxID=168172 RepID=A0ACC0EFA4_9BASI|nr:hypothetical protein MJO28_007201 [Puccinia striiformis f. sp. tritici]
MADNSKPNIPVLTEVNYLQWSMRITAPFTHRGLLKYVLEPSLHGLFGAPAEAVAKKHAETVDWLFQFISEEVFETVVTPDIVSNPHLIWANITSRFASASVNNKGRIWLKFIQYKYRGNLKVYITDMRKMLNELTMVSIGAPENILSFTILAKLSEDLYNVVNNIIMNEVICESPNAVLIKLQEMVYLDKSRQSKPVNKGPSKATDGQSEQRRNRKNGNFCEPGKDGKPGKHNPDATLHDVDHCWQVHPERRPDFNSSNNPVTQLVEVDNGHESEVSLLLTHADEKPIVLDTGATHHMVNDASIFVPVSESNIRILTGGHKNFLNATAIGTAVLVNQDGDKMVLDNVLLVPALNRSLLSVTRLFERDLTITNAGQDKVVVMIDGHFKLSGSSKNNLLELSASHFEEINLASSCLFSSPVHPDWHVRLGHPNPQYQKILVPDSSLSECDICKMCKLKALPYGSNFKQVTQVLGTVHMDLVGPFSTRSTSGFVYFLTIIDQFSGYRTVKFLKSKGEAFDKFKEFKALAENQTGQKLRTIISDGGGEFINNDFKDLCASEGIEHHVSPAYNPQNNGMAERANQTILVKARCLLFQSKLPRSFWAEAVNTANQLANFTPSATRKMKIPYEIWTGQSVNLDVLRPFGCGTFSLIPTEKRKFKLLPTAERGIMLGYENDFSSYRVYKPTDRKVYRIRNVKFDENIFPGLKEHIPSEEEDLLVMDEPNDEEQIKLSQVESCKSSVTPEVHKDAAGDQSEVQPTKASTPAPEKLAKHNISSDISTDNILSVNCRGNSILVYLTENVEDNTPKSYMIQAINSADSSFWKKAIDKEVSNMEDHDVWVIVKKDDGQKRINCTWVFKVKKDQLNIPIEYKAQLCAKGFQQKKGFDYLDTYAPTGKMVDVKSAFLNAPLKEELYLNPPAGVEVPAGHVLKLQKAMYGLKQAPNAWHDTLTKWLFQVGFKRCDAEPCVFWRKGTFLYLHVDDLAIFSKNPSEFKEQIKARFQIKDLGESNLLLGTNVHQEPGAVTLSQRHYIDAQLERFELQHLYPSSTPMKPGGHLVQASRAERLAHLESGNNYRSLVGALNYLSVTTQPDITFAVSSLSQFLNSPGTAHWEAGVQVFWYLKGTRDIGLKFMKLSTEVDSLVGYADTDWASCPESRRSVSGNLVLLNGNVISWKSKKQPTLSLLSTEAEYKSVGDITKEVMWIKTLLKKIFNIKIAGPTQIFEDNQGAIALANDVSNHSNYKTKHMSLKHHFIRREIKNESITLQYVRSNQMLADFLTKAVGKTSIKRALGALQLLCSLPKRL